MALLSDFRAIQVPIEVELSGLPELNSLTYDQWILRLSLAFQCIKSPVYLSFSDLIAFRVMSEGDLVNYWNPKNRPSGWLWRVQSGGWLELESKRTDFVSGNYKDVEEYLVLGDEDCISVLSISPPKLMIPE